MFFFKKKQKLDTLLYFLPFKEEILLKKEGKNKVDLKKKKKMQWKTREYSQAI